MNIDTIRGIGPKTKGQFSKFGVTMVEDLLFHETQRLIGMVDRLASDDEVADWQRIARFTEVRGVGVRLAEALNNYGATSISAFSKLSFSEFQKVIDTASIANVNVDIVCEILRDASVTNNTASLGGQVVDHKGAPIVGVTVAAGDLETITGITGHFRINRILAADSPALVFSGNEIDVHIVNETQPIQSNDFVFGEKFTFKRLAPAAKKNSIILRELIGDEIPPIGRFRIRTQNFRHTQIPEGDILIVADIDIDDKEAKLVSRFREFRDGVIYASGYRVPLKFLPEEAATRETVLFENGALELTDVDDDAFQQELAIRQCMKKNSIPANGQPDIAFLNGLFEDRNQTLLRTGR